MFEYKTFPKLDQKLLTSTRARKILRRDSTDFKRLTGKRSAVSQAGVTSLEDSITAFKVIVDVWLLTLSHIVWSLKKPRNLTPAFHVLFEMKARGVPIPMEYIERIIELCGICKVPEKALKLIEMLPELGLSYDGSVYSSLLKVFAENGALNRAGKVPLCCDLL